jgi:hypothetical protein
VTDWREPGVGRSRSPGLPPDGEHGREHHEVAGIHGTEPVCLPGVSSREGEQGADVM